MTRWCIECAQQQQHQAATKTVDGDPLCDFHAKEAIRNLKLKGGRGTTPSDGCCVQWRRLGRPLHDDG